MNQLPGRRFTKGLSSGLSILAIFAVGYCLSSSVNSVYAEDPLTTQAKSPNNDFKTPPKLSDAITSKKETGQTDVSASSQSPSTPLAIDESKGVPGSVASESDNGDKGELQDFQATAYCLKGRTASGTYTEPGVIAADPRVLPLGTVVHIRAGRYTGTYTVKDTGGHIRGRKVDIYVPNYREAKAFGRQRIKIKVISGKSKRKAADPARKNRTQE